MRLEDDELVFYDFEWLVDYNVVSHHKSSTHELRSGKKPFFCNPQQSVLVNRHIFFFSFLCHLIFANYYK